MAYTSLILMNKIIEGSRLSLSLIQITVDLIMYNQGEHTQVNTKFNHSQNQMNFDIFFLPKKSIFSWGSIKMKIMRTMKV